MLGCSTSVWRELADALRETRPDDAVSVYRRLVEDLLEGTQHYRDAVKLLKVWRDTLASAGREASMAPDLDRIREQNRRRPKLIQLLDKAGLAGSAAGLHGAQARR